MPFIVNLVTTEFSKELISLSFRVILNTCVCECVCICHPNYYACVCVCVCVCVCAHVDVPSLFHPHCGILSIDREKQENQKLYS